MQLLGLAPGGPVRQPGLTVNAKIATKAADYFYRLMIQGNLRKYATYFTPVSGETRSRYITRDLSWG